MASYSVYPPNVRPCWASLCHEAPYCRAPICVVLHVRVVLVWCRHFVCNDHPPSAGLTQEQAALSKVVRRAHDLALWPKLGAFVEREGDFYWLALLCCFDSVLSSCVSILLLSATADSFYASVPVPEVVAV